MSTAAKSFNLRGVVQAASTAININVDKLRGVDVSKKYGPLVSGNRTPVNQATPYRRPPTRTV
jgi:hypothetical protein